MRKSTQIDNESGNGSLAGVLVIAMFSMCIGILLGFLVAS